MSFIKDLNRYSRWEWPIKSQEVQQFYVTYADFISSAQKYASKLPEKAEDDRRTVDSDWESVGDVTELYNKGDCKLLQE